MCVHLAIKLISKQSFLGRAGERQMLSWVEGGGGVGWMLEYNSIPVEFCSDRDGRVSIKLGGLGGGCGLARGAGLLGLKGSAIFGVNGSATIPQNRPPSSIL